MATLQERYDALCEAIDSGERRVKYADKEIEYRSLSEMTRIKSSMEAKLGLSKSRYTYTNHSKGFNS